MDVFRRVERQFVMQPNGPIAEAVYAGGLTDPADRVDPRSPMEREMYFHLLKLVEDGVGVVPQVEVQGYFVDFMLIQPNGAQLAIELDGRRYHDADRDRVRDRVIREAGVVDVVRIPARWWYRYDQGALIEAVLIHPEFFNPRARHSCHRALDQTWGELGEESGRPQPGSEPGILRGQRRTSLARRRAT